MCIRSLEFIEEHRTFKTLWKLSVFRNNADFNWLVSDLKFLDDDVCYTGETTDSSNKKTWTRGCADSSIIREECTSLVMFWTMSFIKCGNVQNWNHFEADSKICTEICSDDLCNENIRPTLPPTTTEPIDPNALICYSCFEMHVSKCKYVQCAESDDVCYTGQMAYNGGYKVQSLVTLSVETEFYFVTYVFFRTMFVAVLIQSWWRVSVERLLTSQCVNWLVRVICATSISIWALTTCQIQPPLQLRLPLLVWWKPLHVTRQQRSR